MACSFAFRAMSAFRLSRDVISRGPVELKAVIESDESDERDNEKGDAKLGGRHE